MTLLEAYTIVLDWLQWGDKFDEEKASMALRLMGDYREENRRLRAALEDIGEGAGYAPGEEPWEVTRARAALEGEP